MVRSIRHCLRCHGRFVANASQERCASCRIGDYSNSNNENVDVKPAADTKHCSLPYAEKNGRLGSEPSPTTCEAAKASTKATSIQGMEEQDGAPSAKRVKFNHQLTETSTSKPEEEEKQEHALSSMSSSASSPTSLLRADSTPLAVIDLCDDTETPQDNNHLDQDFGADAPNRQQEQQHEQPRAKAWDDEDDSQSDACSEAGDDVNCTQIELGDSEDENDTDHLAESESNQATPKQQQEFSTNESVPPAEEANCDSQRITRPQEDEQVEDPSKNGHKTALQNGGHNDDICFICGTSLKTLKHRVDHIKRCSKKHGISARDVAVNDDYEVFANETKPMSKTKSTVDNESKIKNPYARDNEWHGDAVLDLRLAGQQDESNGNDCEVPSSSRIQTKLQSFFQAPVRNLNAVLVSGARRMSKMAQVVSARKEATEASSNAAGTTQVRFGRGGKSFTSNIFSRRPHGECPLYKKITGTDFVCDGFVYANSALTNNYFLTHFHSDHYGGITSSWNAGVIYCSIATAALVNQQLRVDKKYIHPLPMDVPIVIASRGKPVTVTLLDANHCPGAIMFLFQVGKRYILHVGDFRWNRNIMLNQAPLKAFALEKIQLDELFLDTTYCNPKYTLPSQDEAIRETVAVVRKEIQRAKENKCRTLHIFGAYTIGKERIYLAVAEQLGLKIYVDNTRFKILSAFHWPKERMALLTTRKQDTNLWVVPLGHINMKKMPEYLNSKPSYDQIIGYRPTGWSLKASPSGGMISSRSSCNLSIHSIPYSEHSAFNELVDCLQCLRPQKIIPTVNASKSREQVDMLLAALRQKQTMLPFGAKDTRT